MKRTSINIIRKGQLVSIENVDPSQSLLDYLRLCERAMGSKEGCAEGDCGACTVAVGTLRDGKMHYMPVNSCIQLLGMLDGKEVVTVDDLAADEEHLHPVQQAMVSAHASQCGFCTPGFVMSLFCLYHSGERANRSTINDWLAGNLCRCTGYRPIADAAQAVCLGHADDVFSRRATNTAQALMELDDAVDVYIGDDRRFFAAPASTDSLAELYQRYPDATLVAGATDAGLWLTKGLRDLPRVIHVGRVAAMHAVSDDGKRVHIGAAASYAEAEQALSGIDSDIAQMLRRLGSKQVRAAGTIGGNIANGSPIGDSPPVLIALGATLTLRAGANQRSIALEDFFIDYGKQDRHAGEFVLDIDVPHLAANQHFRCYKIAKRFDQDISALLGAFVFTLEAERVTSARIAFGGMAATPKRALQTESALLGLDLHDERSWQQAAAVLSQDYSPLSDLRASARYRMQSAGALLLKARMELLNGNTHTRVFGAHDEAQAL